MSQVDLDLNSETPANFGVIWSQYQGCLNKEIAQNSSRHNVHKGTE